mmetsp:Transcript_16887/g.29246  ORF Transcript_16887/g.29246 Transcript_16887/m.29246 type:complete len:97 (-) Transcript_16887:2081-2371(-)
MRCACVPISRTRPLSSTMMVSACATVDSLCATMTVVRSSDSSLSDCTISCSVAVSKALVASSRTRMAGFLRMMRAMPTRCFSPPDSLAPRSPTRVL